MKQEHISFAQLSDLFDNDINVIDQKEQLLNHIDECKNCSLQYSLLRATIHITSQLGRRKYLQRDFPLRTMEVIRSRRRKKMFMKAMPAIAASCLIIFGAVLYSGLFKNSGVTVAKNHPAKNNTEKIISIIRDNQASITSINDDYIEGEISLQEFQQLRRKLGFRKVLFKVVSQNDRVASGSANNALWRSDIETVGLGTDDHPPVFETTERVVRFRILK